MPGVKWNGWTLMKSRICCKDGLIIWSRAASASLKSILPDIALLVLKHETWIHIFLRHKAKSIPDYYQQFKFKLKNGIGSP